MKMTNESEQLSNRLLVSVNQAKLVVNRMVKNSTLPSTRSDPIESGRPARLGLGAKFIAHAQVAKYDPKIRRLLTAGTMEVKKSNAKKPAEEIDEEDESCKYSNF